MNFAENLKRIRKLRGLSQAELAARCGFATQSRIGNYERESDRLPAIPDLVVLAKVLEVSPNELIGISGDTSALVDVGYALLALADLLRDSMPGAAQELARRIEALSGPVNDPDRLVSRLTDRLLLPNAPAKAQPKP